MFSDTITHVSNSGTLGTSVMNRVQTDPVARWITDDRAVELKVQHETTRANRIRSNMSFRRNQIISDPYLTDRNLPIFSSIGITFNTAGLGDTDVNAHDLIGLLALLSASTNAMTFDLARLSK